MTTIATPARVRAAARAKNVAPITASVTAPINAPVATEKPVVVPKPAVKKARALPPIAGAPFKPPSKARPTASVTSKKTASNTVPSKAVVDRATAARKVVTKKVPAAQPAAVKVALKPAAAPVAVPVVKLEKNAKKHKLVRDSFTIPKAEYTVLEDLKQRAAVLMQGAKKSELLRAGIKALAAMSDTEFLNVLKQVPAIKTGRPAAGS